MDKERIELLLGQIVGAANSVAVAGESNMAQLIGICQTARQIHQLISAPGEEDDDG